MVRDMDTQHVASSDHLWEDVSLIWDNLKTRNEYWRILASSMPSRLKFVRDMLGD